MVEKDTAVTAGALPVPEIEIVHDEIRRIGGRLVPPMPLRYVTDDGVVEVIGLRLAELQSSSGLSLPARIVDISLNGVAIACPVKFDQGLVVELLAVNQETRRVSFHEQFEVCHVRKRELDRQDDPDHPMFVHGARSLATGHSQLYKCLLDSVFLAQANSIRDEEFRVLPWYQQPPPTEV